MVCINVQFWKISTLRRDWKFMEGGSVRTRNLRKCIRLNWDFQSGGQSGSWKKIPVGGVWIFFSGKTFSIED